MSELVRLDRSTAPGVATVLLDRPKVNAITGEMLVAIVAICDELADDPGIRSVVLTGEGRNFAAGADVTQFPDFTDDDARALSNRFNAAALALENLPQVTIAAINGFALGGGFELALATDFRIAASDARVGLPEILLGIIPGGGGTQRLGRLVGTTLAKDLVYSGRNLTAPEALDAGIVSSVHEPEDLRQAANEMAARYAAGPAALRIAKRVMQVGSELGLAEAAELEAAGFAEAFTTEDRVIGVSSFLEHGPGKATFTGR